MQIKTSKAKNVHVHRVLNYKTESRRQFSANVTSVECDPVCHSSANYTLSLPLLLTLPLFFLHHTVSLSHHPYSSSTSSSSLFLPSFALYHSFPLPSHYIQSLSLPLPSPSSCLHFISPSFSFTSSCKVCTSVPPSLNLLPSSSTSNCFPFPPPLFLSLQEGSSTSY